MVHLVMTQTLYNNIQIVLEQCKLTMEFKCNIDLNNARYDATANKYDMKHNNLMIKLNTNAGVFAGFYHGFYRFFPLSRQK